MLKNEVYFLRKRVAILEDLNRQLNISLSQDPFREATRWREQYIELCENIVEQEKVIKQLKTQIEIFECFLSENNLSIDFDEFCGVEECDRVNYPCQYCDNLEFKEEYE